GLSKIYVWQKAPALRLLLPFAAGILWQWHVLASLLYICIAALLCGAILLLFPLFPLRVRYKAVVLHGFVLTALLITIAMLVVYLNDVRNKRDWFGKTAAKNTALLVVLQEPLVEKANTYKAIARVVKSLCNDTVAPAQGQLILYFKKSAAARLNYGTPVWVFKKIEAIKNSGNPAGFDYERYSLFSGITHQVYLTERDFYIVTTSKKGGFRGALFQLRDGIVLLLKKYIKGAQETGLAEALLIGYKDDLDKTLVQSYSNTGVVHIIAISGLHVGLIYALLLLLTKPLRGNKTRWLRFFIVLSALWAFGLLAGAQPSVMRSVVMFSFIAAGVVLDRNPNIYNNLALSALLLLCYNPFWLWDVGFQLSYTAVLSIVIFFKPVYNVLFFENKLLDAVWKLMAVTLAAQLLTTPISLYYFHQFPVLFLFTNILAVPLSSVILIGELLLCFFFFIPPAAGAVGWATTLAIRFLNGYIQRMETISFAVWPGLFISALQAFLLLLFIAGISVWLLEKRRAGLWAGLSCLMLFMALRTFSFFQAARQQEVVVYNIAKHQAIDLYNGRTAAFIGDANLLHDETANRLHLQPSRTAHRIRSVQAMAPKAFVFGGKKILIVDTTLRLQTFSKPHIDVLILSKNPKVSIPELATHFEITQVVLDASVPAWKAKSWQQACDSLRLPCYNVVQKGAFVMTVPRATFAAL
ncbi:MAG TPA: ComEC/Rec2 family competence protein, partial [Chitinophagaceae bacterium]|nr:ComEC/Rec2 family competence protein [Chitinophagaceae bacterium]